MKTASIFMFFVGCVILSSCASAMGDLTRSSLVRPWSLSLKRTERLPYPFFVEFSKGSKRVYFVAGNHENVTGSKTFELIKAAFEKRFVDIVVSTVEVILSVSN